VYSTYLLYINFPFPLHIYLSPGQILLFFLSTCRLINECSAPSPSLPHFPHPLRVRKLSRVRVSAATNRYALLGTQRLLTYPNLQYLLLLAVIMESFIYVMGLSNETGHEQDQSMGHRLKISCWKFFSSNIFCCHKFLAICQLPVEV
jgi:hypothetical protein